MLEWAQTLVQGIDTLPIWQVSLFFFVFGALQAILPFVPGDIVLLIGAGVWTGGLQKSIWPVLGAYWLGTTLFSLLVTEAGRRYGDRILTVNWVRRLLPDKTRLKAEKWLQRWGVLPIFAAKFVIGMNLPMLLLSGVLKLGRGRVYTAVIVTTLVHNSLFYLAGTSAGQLRLWLTQSQTVLAIGIALGLALAYYVTRRHKRKTRKEEPPQERADERIDERPNER